MVGIGLPALSPALRDAFGLTLAEVGVLLSAVWIGATVTLLPWGLLADRTGERWALAIGLGLCGFGLAAASLAETFVSLVVVLAVAGAAGASVNAASGRAVLAWFGPQERGLALGVRQTAIPIGGGIAAVALPLIEGAGGLDAAFLALGAGCVLAALVGAAVIREPSTLQRTVAFDPGPAAGELADAVPWTLRDGRLWRLCAASGLYLVAQLALIGYVVLFLHDERGWSSGSAAGVLAAIQVVAVGARIGAGVWSDRVGARVPPLRRIGVASFATAAVVAALLTGPAALLVAAFVVAGALSMAWNGLSFTAAAELAGHRRAGAAIGFQQTALSVAALVIPIAFAATVSAVSWRAAFALAAICPLLGAAALRGLRV